MVAPPDDIYLRHLARQKPRAGLADGAGGSEHGSTHVLGVDAHHLGGTDRALNGGHYRVAVAGGNADVESCGNGLARITDDRGVRPEPDDLGSEILGDLAALDDLPDRDGGIILDQLPRGQGAADEPPLRLGSGRGSDPGDVAEDPGLDVTDDFLDPRIREELEDRVLERNVLGDDCVEDESELGQVARSKGMKAE